ncbi:CPBP family intramembrane glutamic endopeptidase [Roseobacter sinensis]|uniref:CPBP family intramembrane metalloprotease n=1 Tax=Roseobacter sinensis TaxID=2931391 RepID=A0ABT3B984_9RHOB|nr:type II CAAX endopeptidase family protein [Roseobacter sp. WL0113]MCV3270130.1 CPBP family intramembrane metalloprotease [Roseobacter sp. WL0113]
MFWRTAYRAHEALIAPARETAQIWRLVMGLIIAAGVYLLCNQIFFQTLFTWQGRNAPSFAAALDRGDTPVAMFLLLFSFAFMIVGVVVAMRVVHKRGFGGTLGDLPLCFAQMRAVLTMLILVNAVVWILPPWDMGAPLVSNLSLGVWLLLLPMSLLSVLIQVSAEEVLFRGYIQQQLAARFRSPVVWMLIPSVLFGMGHYLPEEAGSNAQAIAIWATVFGLLMADLTARAGTLGPAIAVHLVNNVTAILIISMPDTLSGLALYLSPFSMADTDAVQAWLPVDFAFMVVSWLAARLAIRR